MQNTYYCYFVYRKMSNSPSYSPSIADVDNPFDPIRYPFNFAQDNESYYAELAQATCLEHQQPDKQTSSSKKRKLSKRKTITQSTSSSYVIRRQHEKGRRLIKICVYDLNSNGDTMDIDESEPNISVQYIVKDNYDNVMDSTETLINRIVTKIGEV